MALTHETEHVVEGLAQLAHQFRELPKVEALLGAFLEQIQDVEDMLFSILDGLVLDDAVGAQLDLLGAIVGEPREARDDATYRLWIRSRILLNRSSGLTEEIYDIFEPLLPAPAVPNISDFYPAAIELTVEGGAVTAALVLQLAKMLKLARAAAIGAQLIWSAEAASEVLRFAHPTAFLVAGTSSGAMSLTVYNVSGTFAEDDYYILLGVELLSVTAFDGSTFDLVDPTTEDHDGGEPVLLGASATAANGLVTALLTGATAVVAGSINGTFPAAGPYLIWVGGHVLQVASFASGTLSLAAPYPGPNLGGAAVFHLDLANSLRISDASTAHLAGGVLVAATEDGAPQFLSPHDTEWFPPGGGGGDAAPPEGLPGDEPFVGPPL